MSLYCSFVVSNYYFGIPVDTVQEVMRGQSMSVVPLARAEVRGLINLRGQIVTAIDLRRRLRIEDSVGSAPAMNVLIQSRDGAVSLLVDKIEEVIEVSDDLIERPPETMQSEVKSLVIGACKLSERLMLILNTAKVLEF